ncbi:MAG TPA: sulfate adenylyltransferase, partial [Candidatus Hydrogenedentes bacterium]|nr:sulfate adenylyltransferase [Candidatus Hydrogenedentota bacterium]
MSLPPLGGTLVNRFVAPESVSSWEQRFRELPVIRVDAYAAFDIDGIAKGIFSPLEGFMGAEETERVLERMELRPGIPWTIPILLAVDRATADRLTPGEPVALVDDEDRFVAVLHLREKFTLDKAHLAEKVYRTTDTAHPGVAYTMSLGDVFLAGPLEVLRERTVPFQEYNLPPSRTRQAFQERGWRRIVAFQTRNPIHRAHEYLTKCALEICDGLLIHPLMGTTKSDDIPGEV